LNLLLSIVAWAQVISMKSSTVVALFIKAEEFVTIKNRTTKLFQLSTARLEDYMNKVKPEAATE
jgi:hypothetical protein